MTKSSIIYRNMPNNFHDDLADALMNAFEVESVDAIDEIPLFLEILYQRGFKVMPRHDKEHYFIRTFVKAKGNISHHDRQLIKRLRFYDFRSITDIEPFRKMLQGYGGKSFKEFTEERIITFSIGNIIDCKLMRKKL